MGKIALNRQGYTLVEMVVTSALIGLLSVGIISVFISTIQGGKTARAQANVKVQGDFAISSMERVLRNAIKFPVCTEGGRTIMFQYFDGDGTEVNQSYHYDDENNQIEVIKNGVSQGYIIKSGQLANAMEVTEASFLCTEGTGYSPGFVTVGITLHSVGDSRQQTTQQFQTTVTMRNIP